MMAAQLSTGPSAYYHTNRLGELADFCVHPDRWLPVVVVSPGQKFPALGKMDIWLNVRELASDLAGSAHVMVIRLGR